MQDEIKLCFEVIDTGIGIPDEKQAVIFDSFTQASSDTTRKYGGTGLGLTIVKKLAHLMDGYVDIESKVGEGSTFKVFLPYLVNQRMVKEKKDLPRKIEIPSTIQQIKILLVEDNEFNQIVAKESLENFSEKFKIEIAHNGNEAIQKLKSIAYDIVLMDIQMPEMDGFEATKIIRHEKTLYQSIPIVAMTAHAMTQEIEKCFKVGMNDYISKPFVISILVDKILKQLNIQAVFTEAENEQLLRRKKEEIIERNNEQKNETNMGKSQERVTDLTYLKQFSGGDSERIKKYVNIYLKTAPSEVLKMANAIEVGDYHSIYRAAHGLKPQVMYMGIKSMEEMIRKIENNAKNNENLNELPNQIKIANTIFQQSFDELHDAILQL